MMMRCGVGLLGPFLQAPGPSFRLSSFSGRCPICNAVRFVETHKHIETSSTETLPLRVRASSKQEPVFEIHVEDHLCLVPRANPISGAMNRFSRWYITVANIAAVSVMRSHIHMYALTGVIPQAMFQVLFSSSSFLFLSFIRAVNNTEMFSTARDGSVNVNVPVPRSQTVDISG